MIYACFHCPCLRLILSVTNLCSADKFSIWPRQRRSEETFCGAFEQSTLLSVTSFPSSVSPFCCRQAARSTVEAARRKVQREVVKLDYEREGEYFR